LKVFLEISWVVDCGSYSSLITVGPFILNIIPVVTVLLLLPIYCHRIPQDTTGYVYIPVVSIFVVDTVSANIAKYCE